MTHKELFVFPPMAEPQPVGGVAFGVIGLAHSHIYSMCDGLIKAGGELRYVYDPEEKHIAGFLERYPWARACGSEAAVLEKTDISLIVSASVPAHRAEVGIRAMETGKDFFVDKAPMTTLEQVAAVRRTCCETGRKCFVYYGESVCDPSALYARELIRRGVIGKVIHVDGVAPHRLSPAEREPWFFQREHTGGILTDLVCHQIHQFLEFTGNDTARVDMGRAANYAHPRYPGWDDFGDFACTGENGAAGFFRVDWFTPDGLGVWGDGRMLIVGTEGYIELRKNVDILNGGVGSFVYAVTREGVYRERVDGKVPVTFFHDLLRDCLNRTDTAISQKRAFRAIELAIEAQQLALNKKVTPDQEV